jgi:hypothetical protein
MAWSFCRLEENPRRRATRTAVQMKQEAAVVLALGGGYEAYFKQRADLSVEEWQMDLMAEVAAFCRAREPWCHKARSVPQVGLLYSASGLYRASPSIFNPRGGERLPTKGTLQCLLASGQAVDILMDHHLEERAGAYPLIVVPEWAYLAPTVRRRLVAYAEGGGNLLVIGPRCARLFRDRLRVELVGRPELRVRYLAHAGMLAGTDVVSQRVRRRRGAKVFGRTHETNDPRSPAETAATVAPLGKGRIAGVYLDLGTWYRAAATTVARDFLAALVRELFPEPIVEVAGSRSVEVTVHRIGSKLAVNLVNTAGPHADPAVYTYDEVPALGPLEVTIRAPERPKRIMRRPAGRRMRFTWRDGAATVRVPRLAIHEVLVVE